MKTIETYLPVFPGFYGTIFEANEHYVLDDIAEQREERKLTPISYDLIELDYRGYNDNVGKNCCDFIESELSDFISHIQFQQIESPREYNFRNDSINCIISLSDENIKAIKVFLIENKTDFEGYIKEAYTSRSGFISSYSNNSTDWLVDIDNCLEHKHMLGSILEFICWCWDINQDSMADYRPVDLEVINYDDVYYNEYCPVCGLFVSVNKFHGNCCDNCQNTKIKDLDLILCSKCKAEINNPNEKRHFEHQIKHGFINYSEVVCNDCETIF